MVKRKAKVEQNTQLPDEDTVLKMACNAPAPVVVNGGTYCGCQLVKDHEGRHEIYISWER